MKVTAYDAKKNKAAKGQSWEKFLNFPQAQIECKNLP